MTIRQRTILVVEDEQDAAEMFAEMMRVNGFRVLKATGCETAISLINAEKPAAVLLDIMMPDISGLEVLRFIQHEPGLSSIPVIVVSAKSLPADIKNVLEAGASIYLTKPVDYLDLKQAVEQVLGA
jgi:CheY-like chemotaxis protein